MPLCSCLPKSKTGFRLYRSDSARTLLPGRSPTSPILSLAKNIAPASGTFARDGPFVRQYDCSQGGSVVQLRGVVHSWIDCPDDPNLTILFLKAEPGGEKVMQSLRDMLVAQAYTSTVSPSAPSFN